MNSAIAVLSVFVTFVSIVNLRHPRPAYFGLDI